MSKSIVLAATMVCMIASCAMFGPPAPPKADYTLVDDFGYPCDRAAQKEWKPMGGTAPVSVARLGDKLALRMPCNFEGTKIDRASWDRSVELDLTTCQGLQFRLFCEDPSPVSGFTLYLQSGDGWYSVRFAPEKKGEWCTIKIDKSRSGVEGSPAGWGKIKTLRLSAWRGKDVDTEFYIADLGLLGADAEIAIVRGESVAKKSPDEAKSVAAFSQNVAQCLSDVGLPYAMISDLDVTAKRLRGKRIVILPHNPSMPDNVADELVKYIKDGGKIIGFYGLNAKLREAVGIPGGNHIKQEHPGTFASIHFTGNALPGAPKVVGQRSWNISESKALKGKSRVAAYWYDDQGKSTGQAAVVVSDSAIQMTHVLITDDLVNKRNMLLAMVGHFAPDLWRKAATRSIGQIGRLGPYATFREAKDGLWWAGLMSQPVTNNVEEATRLRNQASGLCSEGKYAKAMDISAKAQKLMLEAYCLAQKPEKREHRAWWCHSAFGVEGMTWDEAIKNLADNGFTAVLPNMLWGGTAFYKSDVLPVDPSVKEKGDQIALCVAACKKYGIECHVWKVNWNMGSRSSKEFVAKMVKEGRTQVLYDGTKKERWLCPSNPANQKLEIDSMVEVARKYDVDGIHFDYIRYPGGSSCFCKGCRERFEKVLGHKVKNWPEDCKKDEKIKQKWLDFRRSNITKVVAAVSEQARKVKPKIKISAAVFRNWPVDRDGVGQDWKLWCEKGYLDFVCPMDYTPINAQFENIVKLQKGWAGKVPCYPGIGLSCWKPSNDICKLIDQIKITRKLGTGGFTIFNYGVSEAKEMAPLCGKGITRKR
ncbi:MAG: family 10 glycosylhydrolase [Planctomycetes bacterium]|nr:family 10 glycosylhydrolase [Planctomycetota bacterium]